MPDTLVPVANEATAPVVSGDVLYEVVRGQVVELEPMGAYQIRIAFVLANQIENFAKSGNFGRAVTEMLFVLDVETTLRRRPDVAFVSFERWPRDRRIPETEAWDVVPNLAVEVVSPTNDFDEVLQKVSEYFEAGVELVWVVIPSRKQVYVYRSETDLRVLTLSDHLDGENVLSGFSFSVAELLEEIDVSQTAK
jgi:Uma2 family endonuclease